MSIRESIKAEIAEAKKEGKRLCVYCGEAYTDNEIEEGQSRKGREEGMYCTCGKFLTELDFV